MPAGWLHLCLRLIAHPYSHSHTRAPLANAARGRDGVGRRGGGAGGTRLPLLPGGRHGLRGRGRGAGEVRVCLNGMICARR